MDVGGFLESIPVGSFPLVRMGKLRLERTSELICCNHHTTGRDSSQLNSAARGSLVIEPLP